MKYCIILLTFIPHMHCSHREESLNSELLDPGENLKKSTLEKVYKKLAVIAKNVYGKTFGNTTEDKSDEKYSYKRQFTDAAQEHSNYSSRDNKSKKIRSTYTYYSKI